MQSQRAVPDFLLLISCIRFMSQHKRRKTLNESPYNDDNSLRIIGTEESLERWKWLFQILEKDGTIEIVSHPDRTYEMRNSNLLRQYWQIRTRF
jgi:hypothetical protein